MNWKESFENPPRKYGVYPIIHERITDPDMLERFDKIGFAGVAGNVKYTFDYPENKEIWEDTEKGFRAYNERGMTTWIYDENGYPSGTASGAVLERHPEYEALNMVCIPYWLRIIGVREYRADAPDGRLYKALLSSDDGTGNIIDVTDSLNEQGKLSFTVPEGTWQLWFFVERSPYDSTHVLHSFSEVRRYIDLFDAEATREFMNVTHEKYYERLSDKFGNGIKAFFTDEPSLMGWNIIDASYTQLPWSKYFAERFEKRYGYGAEKALLAVCTGEGPEAARLRCDFWEFTADEIAKNFFKVMNDWCVSHGVLLSGHLVEEEDYIGHIFSYGSYYRSIREFGCPGIDRLSSDPATLMNHNRLPSARLAASAADVYDHGESFTEASGHDELFGRNVLDPVSWMYGSVNWHFALGINNITSYYPTEEFEDGEMSEWNKYTARLGTVLRRGKRFSRAAVLYPESSTWAAFKPTEHERHGGQSELMNKIDRSFVNASWAMLDRQIDFDYINEQDVAAADVINGRLAVRSRRYECLVLPCTYVLTDGCLEKLCGFIDAGGTVIALERLPEISRDTGLESKYYDKMLRYKADGKLFLISGNDYSAVTERLPRTVRLTPNLQRCGSADIKKVRNEVLSHMILSHVRTDGDEMTVFLCNMGARRYVGAMELPENIELTRLDAKTGTVEELAPTREVSLNIPAYNSAVYVLKVKALG